MEDTLCCFWINDLNALLGTWVEGGTIWLEDLFPHEYSSIIKHVISGTVRGK